ncbi:unnamed protein product [Peniophora sp. CBMAI 1063]|nr:unnamed protein product [Peniophora sp. CBMAI 1063]
MALLRQRIENSVVARSFGVEVALDRVRRFARAAYGPYVSTGQTMSLDDFILRSLGDATTQSLLQCLMFFAYGALHLHESDCVMPWLDLAPYCVLDYLAPDPHLIVPTRPFIPFDGTSRAESALRRTNMLPLFFKRTRTDGGLGVSVAADADYEAIPPDTATRISGSSLKVRVNLLNYAPYERQIQLRCRPNETVPARRLARLVAAKVRDCIEKASQENVAIVNWENPNWKFGTGVDCYRVEHVLLLGVVFVSPGKVTPLLQVRPLPVPLTHPNNFVIDYGLLY